MDIPRVLLIDDEEAVLKRLGNFLVKEHFDVVKARTGTEGLKLFFSENPDVVITDLRLPGKDGLQIIESVNAARPGVPVIIITGYGDVGTTLEAIRLGALDYLRKPFELQTLLLALDRAMERVVRNHDALTFPTVLLADDEPRTRQRLAKTLTKEGWQVIQCADGATALEKFKRSKVDVALLDIKMPRLDGIELLLKLREITDDFKAIIVTAHGDEDAAIKALRAGAMSFVQKPVNLDEIITTTGQAIERLTVERSLKYRAQEAALRIRQID